jgi:hypothetical protein
MPSTTARITLTVTAKTDALLGHLDYLATAAREGFKVDGWTVTDAQANFAADVEDELSWPDPEDGDFVRVRAYDGPSDDSREYGPRFFGTGTAKVLRTDHGDDTVLVQFLDGPDDEDGDAVKGRYQWVHVRFLSVL